MQLLPKIPLPQLLLPQELLQPQFVAVKSLIFSVQTFVRIIFPLSLPGMFSGITMVFVPALTTFVISKILGGSKILLIGNVIEQEFTQTGNWNLGSGLSIVLMLFIIFNMVISVITDKEGEANTL